MEPLIVPAEALESREKFERWHMITSNHLFPYNPYKITRKELRDKQLRSTIFDAILKAVNYIYNGDKTLIDYKRGIKKFNQYDSEVIGLTIYIMRTHYQISYTNIGDIIQKDHANVIYHYKKHAGLIELTQKNRMNYMKLLKHLQDEEIIPVI